MSTLTLNKKPVLPRRLLGLEFFCWGALGAPAYPTVQQQLHASRKKYCTVFRRRRRRLPWYATMGLGE